MSSQSPDMVNNPDHYQFDGFEVIDIIRANLTAEQFKGWIKANVIKYVLREQFKEQPLQDVQKAQWYLNLYHDILSYERMDKEEECSS